MELPKSYWWALASVVAMAVGAFGPWVTVLQTVTFGGTDDRTGWTVFGCAVAAALILALFVRVRNPWLCIVPFLAAALGVWVAGYNIHDIRSVGNSGLESTGWGIWVALGGSISLGLASIVLGVQTGWAAPDERIPIPGSTGKAKIRRPWAVFWLSFVTFGIYYVYWYYQANRELSDYGFGTSPVTSVVAQTLGALIIVPPFVSWWRFFDRILLAQGHADTVDRVEPGVGFVLYLIGIFFLPFELVYAQKHLNQVWETVGAKAPVEAGSRHFVTSP